MQNLNDFLKELQETGLENTVRLFYSIYHAFCVENKDPKEQGRIKIRVPQITGEETIEEWAYPISMSAAEQSGFVAVPEVGDGVWVVFKGGNPRFPAYFGGWWGLKGEESELPTVMRGGDYPFVRGYQSPSGNYIIFTDVEGKETVKAANKGGDFWQLISGILELQGNAEPSVLGDTNAKVLTKDIELLQSTIGEIKALIVAINAAFTAFAAAAPPLAAATATFATAAAAIDAQLSTHNAQLEQLKIVEVPKTKSKKVKLS